MPTQATIRRVWTVLRLSTVTSVCCGLFWAASTSYAEPRHPAPPHEGSRSGSSRHIEGQFERAGALVQAGQWRDAEQIYRGILRELPNHELAYQALVDLSTARELPALSYPARSAQARLDDRRFEIHQTPRFILFSDVTDARTQQNADWVERTHEEFMRFAQECGLRPLPLEHKLVCILFDRRSDYLSFAQAQDGLTNIGFTGYYSPRHDRVVFSVENERTSRPERAPAVADNSSREGDGKLLGFESDGARVITASHQPHVHDESCQAPTSFPGAAKCVHETIHQLMFHTRVMAPDVQYPLWICEGLSTAFETDAPSQPFGPDYDYLPRRQAFETLLRDRDVLPLRELVPLTELSSYRPRTVHIVYQQSYALVTWMCRERREQLRDYLHLMRQQSAGKLSASRHIALFEHCFGMIEEVERDWLDYERDRLISR